MNNLYPSSRDLYCCAATPWIVGKQAVAAFIELIDPDQLRWRPPRVEAATSVTRLYRPGARSEQLFWQKAFADHLDFRPLPTIGKPRSGSARAVHAAEVGCERCRSTRHRIRHVVERAMRHRARRVSRRACAPTPPRRARGHADPARAAARARCRGRGGDASGPSACLAA